MSLDFALKTALAAFLLSLVILPFVMGMLKTASRDMPKPPIDKKPPKPGPNLDAPTYIRKGALRGVHSTPPCFRELRPMPPSKDERERLENILRP